MPVTRVARPNGGMRHRRANACPAELQETHGLADERERGEPTTLAHVHMDAVHAARRPESLVPEAAATGILQEHCPPAGMRPVVRWLLSARRMSHLDGCWRVGIPIAFAIAVEAIILSLQPRHGAGARDRPRALGIATLSAAPTAPHPQAARSTQGSGR